MQFALRGPTQDEQYLSLLQDIDFQPIFIMGTHRSGTTLLYKLLVATGCFNFLTSYHIIKYDEILFNHVNRTEEQAKRELSELFKSMGLKDRIIDNVAIGPDMLEEYGFILVNAGYSQRLNPRNLHVFFELCKKVQFVSAQARPLLLKNPYDYPNFKYVKAALPEAKFIFIHRHPLHVINSQLRTMRTELATKSSYRALIHRRFAELCHSPLILQAARLLVSSNFGLALWSVTRGFVQSSNYFLQNVGSLPKADFISLRFEDICEDPKTNVDRILRFIGLEQSSTLDYKAFIEPRTVPLLEEVKRKRRSISNKLAIYLAYWKYDPYLG